MNLTKYADYFHDGDIYEIVHLNNYIKIGMQSAQLLPEWNEDNLKLSKINTISGYLHISEIEEIKIDNYIFTGTLKIENDGGEIVDFEVNSDKIILIVCWIKFSTNRPEDDPVVQIEIRSKKIYWEDVPNINWEN